MESKTDIKKFLPSLKVVTELIAQKIKANPEIAASGFKITSETWVNDNGVGLGAVSCLRDPSEEAIELTIDITRKEKGILCWIGIYWSDGRVIKEIGELTIPERSFSESKISFLNFLENNYLKVIDLLTNYLIQQKKA